MEKKMSIDDDGSEDQWIDKICSHQITTESHEQFRDFAKSREISFRTVALNEVDDVKITIGRDRHYAARKFQSFINNEEQIYFHSPKELHVSHRNGEERYSSISDTTYFQEGAVFLTYLGVTDHGRRMRVSIDLSRKEALELAKSLLSNSLDIDVKESKE